MTMRERERKRERERERGRGRARERDRQTDRQTERERERERQRERETEVVRFILFALDETNLSWWLLFSCWELELFSINFSLAWLLKQPFIWTFYFHHFQHFDRLEWWRVGVERKEVAMQVREVGYMAHDSAPLITPAYTWRHSNLATTNFGHGKCILLTGKDYWGHIHLA